MAGPTTSTTRFKVARTAARFRRRFRVTLSGHPGSFTSDVSVGGFCIEAMRVLPTGTRVQGALLVDGVERPFTGAIAWSRPGDARLGVRGRMGIRFDRPPADFAALMERPGTFGAG